MGREGKKIWKRDKLCWVLYKFEEGIKIRRKKYEKNKNKFKINKLFLDIISN